MPPLNLPWASLPSHLPDEFGYLCEACCSNGMPSRRKAPAWVNGQRPVQAEKILVDTSTHLFRPAEAQFLDPKQLSRSHGIMDFDHLYFPGPDACHLIGLMGGSSLSVIIARYLSAP